MSNSSTSPIDRTLLGALIPGQSGPGKNGNKGVLSILQNYIIAGASPSDCLVSLVGVGSYPSAEMQSVYSAAPAD